MTVFAPDPLSGAAPADQPSDGAAIEVLLDLVSTPSPSGDESAAAERFVHHATSIGLEAEIDEAGNAIARRRARADAVERPIDVVLLGHIDTVPGNIPVRVERGVLHGRGSVDAKGPLAAMLIAAARADLPDNVTLHVVGAVGEESPTSPGARHVAQTLRPDACIIGEPSAWDGVTLGYKGRLVVRAETVCPPAHSAGPDPSAPDTLHAWWTRVLGTVARLAPGEASPFETLQATIHSWEAGADPCVEQAAMTAGFRLPLSITPDDLEREIAAGTSASILLTFSSRERAHCTTRDDPVVGALSRAIREAGATPRHKRKTGTADLNVVAPIWRCPIAAYGPGDSSLDHTPHEHLHIEEYVRSIRVLTRALETLPDHLTAD